MYALSVIIIISIVSDVYRQVNFYQDCATISLFSTMFNSNTPENTRIALTCFYLLIKSNRFLKICIHTFNKFVIRGAHHIK